MTNELRRVDTALIYPPFVRKVEALLSYCGAHGSRYVATMGYRSFSEQTQLWKQGRLTPGNIVTQAKGGQSQHNWGLAIDFVSDRLTLTDALDASWKEEDYDRLVEATIQKDIRLHSGRPYHDSGHVGWPGILTSADMLPLRENWNDQESWKLPVPERLARIWRIVDNLSNP